MVHIMINGSANNLEKWGFSKPTRNDFITKMAIDIKKEGEKCEKKNGQRMHRQYKDKDRKYHRLSNTFQKMEGV